jgi:hypothetical protein
LTLDHRPLAVSASTDRTAASLRWILALALLGGIAWAGSRYPAVPEQPWPEARTYRPDEAVCNVSRDARQWTFFEVPRTSEPVTAAVVAERFQLESAAVCRANAIPDCDRTRVEPGRRLVLPLSADSETIAAAREAAGAEAGSGRRGGGG